MNHLVTLVLKVPRDTQVSPEATHVFLAALLDINKLKLHQKLRLIQPNPLALEIVLRHQEIFFQITGNSDLVDIIEGQIQAAYPQVSIEEETSAALAENIEVAKLTLKSGNFYPIKTYASFREVDSLASILSVLARAAATDFVMIQYVLKTVSAFWQVRAEAYASEGTKRPDGTYLPRPDQQVIREKIKHPGFAVSVRIATNQTHLFAYLAHAFNTFTRSDGNQFALRHPLPFRRAALRRQVNSRTVSQGQILTTEELATLWHLPSEKIKTSSIAWGTAVLSDPPINLPVFTNPDAAQNINFFARTHFKNKETTFGIKDADRSRHLWAIGMTGTENRA